MPALPQKTVDYLNKTYGDTWRNPPNPSAPYQKAPDEYGGGYWARTFVPEPWKTERPKEKELPTGFENIFGPEPGTGDPRRPRWLNNLQYFKQAGKPEGFSDEQIDVASHQLNAWGLGTPAFYEGRYGWRARFPESQLPVFEATPEMAIEFPHLVIAQFQVRLSQEGLRPGKIHPWVPPHIFGDDPK